MKLYKLPQEYAPLLDLKQTELAIKQIKETFQLNLSSSLRLRRVTAPLFVLQGTGLNDDLNGYEHAVNFPIQDMNGAVAEVVYSKFLGFADIQRERFFRKTLHNIHDS